MVETCKHPFMKSAISLLLLAFVFCTIGAQDFEGTIEFKKVKKDRVSTYIYYIRGDYVRLEEFGSNKMIVDIAVADLNFFLGRSS